MFREVQKKEGNQAPRVGRGSMLKKKKPEKKQHKVKNQKGEGGIHGRDKKGKGRKIGA